MRQSDLNFFKGLLKDRKAQIEKNIIDAHKEMDELQGSGATDEADFASISADRLVEQAVTSQQNRELEQINEALYKIKNGGYGICEMCEEEIGVQRLKIKPHARYCIVCREIIEQSSKKRKNNGN